MLLGGGGGYTISRFLFVLLPYFTAKSTTIPSDFPFLRAAVGHVCGCGRQLLREYHTQASGGKPTTRQRTGGGGSGRRARAGRAHAQTHATAAASFLRQPATVDAAVAVSSPLSARHDRADRPVSPRHHASPLSRDSRSNPPPPARRTV